MAIVNRKWIYVEVSRENGPQQLSIELCVMRALDGVWMEFNFLFLPREVSLAPHRSIFRSDSTYNHYKEGRTLWKPIIADHEPEFGGPRAGPKTLRIHSLFQHRVIHLLFPNIEWLHAWFQSEYKSDFSIVSIRAVLSASIQFQSKLRKIAPSRGRTHATSIWVEHFRS